jgi:hypothetical protein
VWAVRVYLHSLTTAIKDPAFYSRGENTRYPVKRAARWFLEPVWTLSGRGKFFFLPGIESRLLERSAYNLVTLPTILSHLHEVRLTF